MRISHKVPVVLTALVFQSASLMALEFEPGAGVGLEYTDNATLAPNGSLNALTSIAYVGARIEENTGPFNLSATTSLNQHHYSKNAFSDERYFNLSASAGWEMIKNRVDWQLKNFYSQSSVNATSSSTPNNLQDTNIFSFGPNIRLPLSGRQTLTLSPQYQRYYYEVLTTDNSQSSLSVNWSYRMNRTTDIGVNTAVREIDYDRQGVPDNTISQMHLVLSGKRRVPITASTSVPPMLTEKDSAVSMG